MHRPRRDVPSGVRRLNRAERRALAKRQRSRHQGRTTQALPRAKVEYIDPEGRVVRTETITADDPAKVEAEAAKRVAMSQREADARRAHELGLWTPDQGDPFTL
jgi:hypothetical protein